MYIVLALIGAAIIGVIIETLVKPRAVRGTALVPLTAAAVGSVVYAVMTWAGIAESNVWLWVASLGGSLVVSLTLALVVTGVRGRADAQARTRLGLSA